MDLKNIIFIFVFILSVGFFVYSLNKFYEYMTVGLKKDDRFDRVSNRLYRVWKIAFAQTKLLRDPKAGILHLVIFWGFILFLFAVAEAIIQGFYSPFSLQFAGPI
ncbi:MAG: Fe-S oxidoreductase, partial [Ignavibacteria bacterium CG_4_9_14_3_um_filter_36_18]